MDHSYFSAACESVGTVRKLQRRWVVKFCLIEESGLNICTKHEEDTLGRICAERSIFKSRKTKGEVRGLADQVRSSNNRNFSSPK